MAGNECGVPPATNGGSCIALPLHPRLARLVIMTEQEISSKNTRTVEGSSWHALQGGRPRDTAGARIVPKRNLVYQETSGFAHGSMGRRRAMKENVQGSLPAEPFCGFRVEGIHGSAADGAAATHRNAPTS